MANLKRVALQTALTGVVLNGDDPLGLAMMPYLDTQEIFLTTWNPEKPELQTHLAKGHPAITVVADGRKRQWITLLQANKQKPIAAIEDIPATFNGSARYNVENAMFAAALSIGLGVAPETIQQALARFTSSLAEVPGRMNEYRGLPFRVILDFAHNAHAFAALSDFANQIEVEGRRLILMFSPGNRREVDFLATARAVAGKFDNYVIRQGSNTFLRADGEVPEILKKHLLSLGVPEESVRTILDYDEAVDYTLNCAAPGDLLVLASGGKYQRTWDRLDVFRTSLLATDKRPKSD
jgi:cyanophycin synthetase